MAIIVFFLWQLFITFSTKYKPISGYKPRKGLSDKDSPFLLIYPIYLVTHYKMEHLGFIFRM
jgi:hypothetical protein